MNYLSELSKYMLLLEKMKRLRRECLEVYNVSDWNNPELAGEILTRFQWIDELVMKLHDGFKKVVTSYQV